MKTSFSARAQKLEQENFAAHREIDILKRELREKTKLIEEMVLQLKSAREECSRLRNMSKNSCNTKYSCEINHCSCNCEGCNKEKDTLKELEKTENRIREIMEINEKNAKEIENIKNENKEWTDFCYRIYGVTANSLKHFPDFPSDSESQRAVCMNLIGKVCKYGCKEIDEHSEFEKLKSKYMRVTSSHKIMHDECDSLHKLCRNENCSRISNSPGYISIQESKVLKENTKHTDIEKQDIPSSDSINERVSPKSISDMLNKTEKVILRHTSNISRNYV